MPSPKTAGLPRKGTAARTIYDCIARAKKGLTLHEIERECGALKNAQLRLNELRGKGLIQVDGEHWKAGGVLSDAPKPKKKTPRPGHFPKQDLEPTECPACGATVYQLLADHRHGGACVYVNIQRRLIVFAGPWLKHKYKDPETGEEKVALLPKEPLTLLEEWTGKTLLGRPATEEERAYYAEHKKVKKPWSIGFQPHLSTCSGWKRWLNGNAEEKRRTWTLKWDKTKRRYGFTRQDNEPRKSMMEDKKEPAE